MQLLWNLVCNIFVIRPFFCACHVVGWCQHFLLSHHIFPIVTTNYQLQSLLNKKRFLISVYTVVKLICCTLTYVTVFFILLWITSQFHYKHDPNFRKSSDIYHLLLYGVIKKNLIFCFFFGKTLLIWTSVRKSISLCQQSKKIFKKMFFTI